VGPRKKGFSVSQLASSPDDSPPLGQSEFSDRSSQLADALTLMLVSGVGPITRRALVDRFGSAAAVLAASSVQLRQVRGVGPELARRLTAARYEINAHDEIQICAEHEIDILVEWDDEYPALLREIHDPPGVLFVRGELLPQDGLAVAVVGTRHATQYGLRQAERLAGGLARAGLTIVSGLARGIDAAAHRAALAAGGRTIAVLGCGVLEIYPPEHAELACEVARQGALVSESPPRMKPMSGLFPQRNRVITGMCLGVVVVEAAERSGALVSARHSMEQGREVFAVPGPIDSRMSRGCHGLIRDGARLVESVDDVLEELGPLCFAAPDPTGRTVRHPAELSLNEQEQAVLDAIREVSTSIDEICATSRVPVNRVLATLSVLESRHLIRRLSGTRVVRP